MNDWPDDELVRSAKQGRREAFEELARRYQERIYNAIFSFTRNHEDADDLAQESFLQAYRSLAGFRERSSFYTWLYRIAVNRTLNHLKKKAPEKGRRDLAEGAAYPDPAADADAPEGRSLKKELQQRIQEAVDGLPLKYRASFLLVVSRGLSHGQAARALGCSENTVSWRLHRARKMLHEALSSYLKGEAR